MRSPHIIKFQRNFPETVHLKLVTIMKTTTNCKRDPIQTDVSTICTSIFKLFCKYWAVDGLLRPKLVADSRIIIIIIK